MTELGQSPQLLSEAFRFLVESGLPVQIVEASDGPHYEIEGQEVHADAIICSAYLLGMAESPQRRLH
jgi:hypothetical protein